MTGTSLDGLDASLVEVTGEGLDMTTKWVGMVNRAFEGLEDVLSPMAEGEPHAPLAYMDAARQLGELHATAVSDLCRAYLPQGQRLHMAVAHGQTLWHAPDKGMSWQLFDPQPLVRHMEVPVCFDLRQADLAAGGDGAPITPISDWVMFRHPTKDRVVINLGGISNATHLPAGGTPQQIRGSDIGPCNLLIDGVVRRLYPDRRFDTDGRIAEHGKIDLEVLALIEDKPARTNREVRSLGREDYPGAWIDKRVNRLSERMKAEDIVASFVDAVARIIGRSPLTTADEVVLAGGGTFNRALVARIRRAMGGKSVVLSDELGVPAQARESAGFAVLGALSQDRVPISLPRVTGSVSPGVAGSWVFPGGTI